MPGSQPLTGRPCDSSHPYPAPDQTAWFDSVEYGAVERRISDTLFDVDPTPVFRMVAAQIWSADCYELHRAEVAADPILTTHTIAVCTMVYPPQHADPIDLLGLNQSGAGGVMSTLQTDGMEKAREVVDGLSLSDRKNALMECVAYINRGFTALHLDVGARFPG